MRGGAQFCRVAQAKCACSRDKSANNYFSPDPISITDDHASPPRIENHCRTHSTKRFRKRCADRIAIHDHECPFAAIGML